MRDRQRVRAHTWLTVAVVTRWRLHTSVCASHLPPQSCDRVRMLYSCMYL